MQSDTETCKQVCCAFDAGPEHSAFRLKIAISTAGEYSALVPHPALSESRYVYVMSPILPRTDFHSFVLTSRSINLEPSTSRFVLDHSTDDEPSAETHIQIVQ